MPTVDVGSLKLMGSSSTQTLRLASTGCLPSCSNSVPREVTWRPQWLPSSPSQGSKVGGGIWDLTRNLGGSVYHRVSLSEL